jgi:hypothetical protein
MAHFGNLNESQLEQLRLFGIDSVDEIMRMEDGSIFDFSSVKEHKPQVPVITTLAGPYPKPSGLTVSNLMGDFEALGRKALEPWMIAGGPKFEDGKYEVTVTRTTGRKAEGVSNPNNFITSRKCTFDLNHDEQLGPTIEYILGKPKTLVTPVSINYKFTAMAGGRDMDCKAVGKALGLAANDADKMTEAATGMLKDIVTNACAHNNHMLRLVKFWLHYYTLLTTHYSTSDCEYSVPDAHNTADVPVIQYDHRFLSSLLNRGSDGVTPIACNTTGDPEYQEFLKALVSKYPYYEARGGSNVYRRVSLPPEPAPVVVTRLKLSPKSMHATKNPEKWLAMGTQYAYGLGLQEQFQQAAVVALVMPYGKPDIHGRHILPVTMPSTLIDAFLSGIEVPVVGTKCRIPGRLDISAVIGANVGSHLVDGVLRQAAESIPNSSLQTREGSFEKMVRTVSPIAGSLNSYDMVAKLCGRFSYGFGLIDSLSGITDRELWRCIREDDTIQCITDYYEAVLAGSSLAACDVIRVPSAFEQRSSKDRSVSKFKAQASFILSDNIYGIISPAWNEGMAGAQPDTSKFNGFEGRTVWSYVTKRQCFGRFNVPNCVMYDEEEKPTVRDFAPILPQMSVTTPVVGTIDLPTKAEPEVQVINKFTPRDIARKQQYLKDMKVRVCPAVQVPHVVTLPGVREAISEMKADPVAHMLLSIMGGTSSEGANRVGLGSKARTLYIQSGSKRVDGVGPTSILMARTKVEEKIREVKERKVRRVLEAFLEETISWPDSDEDALLESISKYMKSGARARFQARASAYTDLKSLPLSAAPKGKRDPGFVKLSGFVNNRTSFMRMKRDMFKAIEVTKPEEFGDCGPLCVSRGLKRDGDWNREPTVADMRKYCGMKEDHGDTRKPGVWWTNNTIINAAQVFSINCGVFISGKLGRNINWAGADRPFLMISHEDDHFQVLVPNFKKGPADVIPEISDEYYEWRKSFQVRRDFFKQRRNQGEPSGTADTVMLRKAFERLGTPLSRIFRDTLVLSTEWVDVTLGAEDTVDDIIGEFLSLAYSELAAIRVLEDLGYDLSPLLKEYNEEVGDFQFVGDKADE